MTDLFNNPSNNYVTPDLKPCSNASDLNSTFEFFNNKKVGVINGSTILTSLDLSNIKVFITEFKQDRKLLNPAEVIYVPGLTKGIQSRSQSFPVPYFITSTIGYENFITTKFDISYNKKFKYVTDNIDSSLNYVDTVKMTDQVDMVLNGKSIPVYSEIDSSLNFRLYGSQSGFDFYVNNVTMTIIDASTDSTSPFITLIDSFTGLSIPQVYTLSEDLSLEFEYARYPNGAELGYVMVGTYPDEYIESDKWIYINHVPDSLNVFDISTGGLYEKKLKTINVGSSGPSDDNVMSGGDYLNYITENNLWDKFGVFKSWLGCVDNVETNEKNLVRGFYLYNPHDFPVLVEMLLINIDA